MRILLPALLLLATPAAAGDLESAVAQVRRLDAELLSRDSATATLQLWCDLHGRNGGARIVARRPAVDPKPAGEAERRDLRVGPEVPVAYRRVDLACGDKVLSRADNWYLPGRLTPEMNTVLNTTQTPFGVVVRPLEFRRRTLSSQLLIKPGDQGSIPPEVLQHRAVLSTPDGAPFSLVVETYSDEVLDSRPRVFQGHACWPRVVDHNGEWRP